ncbi:MAG: ABC transporter ATP-binding protein [Firmicutes bacterium]|nr:ABC transporter ATP-binding protein [Bacillota bacterium]
MLELKSIYKNYLQGKMDVPVLKDISLQVEAGEFLSIMGPSGSGKSTLMNIIGCLDLPTSGEYTFNGENVLKKSDRELAALRNHRIGFVFQTFNLLPRETALDNVELPLIYAGIRRKERRQIAEELLRKVGLADRMNFRPTQLSGGQQQRVAIARAMANHPDVILADEPTGALDTRSGEQIMELFHLLNQEGATIIMITHEPSIAGHAGRKLTILDGRLRSGAEEEAADE